MSDKENEHKQKTRDRAPSNVPPEPCREVVLPHLDAPPPLGKQAIHPRRPAPVVPNREDRIEKQSPNDKNSDDSPSE
jgi:hypothetical protein